MTKLEQMMEEFWEKWISQLLDALDKLGWYPNKELEKELFFADLDRLIEEARKEDRLNIFLWMKGWLEAYDSANNTNSSEKIMTWVMTQSMQQG